eukprot:TRINITY_DN395_c0_g1_i2.p1 TRINITY_DN395_c0_g1~~TRINITY_DN395_c0_g1_i2.p1  ORF type:complete len:149 (+),score=18.83 TRINITY_DN395_c0_g1_i2:186-632(+)
MVAVDDSKESITAVKKVCEIIPDKDKLILIHAHHIYEPGYAIHFSEGELEKFHQKKLKGIKESLQPALDQIKRPYDWIFKEGPPPYTVCCEVHEQNVDILVMGDRGSGSSLRRVFLGSFCNYCLHYAPCNVLVVKDEERANADWEKIV